VQRAASVARGGGPIVVLFVLLVLLPLLASAIFVQHSSKRSSKDRTLRFEAARQTEQVENYFRTSHALTQILAQNPSFASFYTTPGRRTVKIREAIKPAREANEALAYLEDLFPESIGEACFIDVGGAENARAIKGRVEPISNLSDDETGAPFFAPTFALRPSEVFQSRPYISPDTNEWVIANSSPIGLPGRAAPAIVHFEITLESLRLASLRLSEKADLQIVDARTGNTIVDTRYPFVGPKLPSRLGRRALPAAQALGENGELTFAGHRVAYRRVDTSANNANDWIVVSRSRVQTAGLLGWASAWQAAIFIALLLLVPVAFASWRRSQRELSLAARTDGLTGLSNRRSLSADLTHLIPAATESEPLLLAMFDLDGFKLYNDTFGHPAGDTLLTRLANRLDAAVSGAGRAYRMGGDEFCIVARLDSAEQALGLVANSTRALNESGEGFTVSASHGAVLIPLETANLTEALRLADQQLYANKSSSRFSVCRQMTDVLVQMSIERSLDLGEHMSAVADLAETVSLRLGLSREQTDEVKRASSLHDIGKLAIPESILGKPGPLSAAEWDFIRQHTLIGERILMAAPALARCAAIVRSSHEAWDGSGYPDGLIGEQIPLEARILAVCDAFEAMISDRSYRPARAPEQALAELRRCSGTQFDPDVVAAFAVELERLGVVSL
jgi:diguanylate cyclase (GGDEF)-like protein